MSLSTISYSTSALQDIDAEIADEYLEALSRVREIDLLRYDNIDGGRRAYCPSLDELDNLNTYRTEIGLSRLDLRRKYAERI